MPHYALRDIVYDYDKTSFICFSFSLSFVEAGLVPVIKVMTLQSAAHDKGIARDAKLVTSF